MTSMEARKNEMVANLGYIERAWYGVTGATKGAWGAMLNVGRGTTDEQNLAQLRENLARQQERNATLGIKEGKAIYARAYRFLVEYTDREQAAQAFRDGGYAGPVPERVAEFATPADMPVQAATVLILAQAAALRAAQGKLAGLRMRKYEVLRAGSNVEALDIAKTILADIQAVGKGVV